MEAKETIIPDNELTETAEMLYNLKNAMDIAGIKSVLWQQANSQAKLSFPKGFEEGRRVGNQERTREILEWLKTYMKYDPADYLPAEMWQAKLKDWRIDDD